MGGLDTSNTYNGVIYGNGRFVCVGNSGYSYYSTNDTSWVSMNRLDNSSLYGVTPNKWNQS